MADIETHGRVVLESAHSVDETIARVRAILKAKQIEEFCFIDHSGAAERAGLSMPKTQVIVFGNAKAGTPLMLAAPSLAIDLPLKLLVREDAEGRVWVEYFTSEALLQRHGLAESFAANLKAVAAIAAEAAR
jgi:uncharacterized protein (DUF302 family)